MVQENEEAFKGQFERNQQKDLATGLEVEYIFKQ